MNESESIFVPPALKSKQTWLPGMITPWKYHKMPKKKLRNCTYTINDVMNLQGRGNGFYSGGARIIGKVRF